MNELWDIAEKGNRIEFFRYFINFKYNVQVSGIDDIPNKYQFMNKTLKHVNPDIPKR